MTRQGEIVATFGDGEYAFNVARLGERMELEAKTGRGTREMLVRLVEGRESFTEIRETIRIGLVGGGMEPEKALGFVRRHVDEFPRARAAALAREILKAEIVGTPDEAVGKAPAEPQAPEARTSRSSATTDASAAPPSTD